MEDRKFCYANCEHLSITEEQQDKETQTSLCTHICNLYKRRVIHGSAHPEMYKLTECDYVQPEVVDPLQPDCFGTHKEKNVACAGMCDYSKSCWENTNMLTGTGESEIPEGTIKTAPKNNAKEGKPRSSLIPWDILIEYLTAAYEEGLLKYTRESWREGFKVTDLYDALQRHINAFFFDREDYDPDAAKLGVKKHHLAGAMFCILSILWTLKTRPELDDRPTHTLNQKDKDE